MKIFNSFKIAFSMYSIIPMPKTKWTKENMGYILCFFPLVGLVISAIIIGINYISTLLELSRFFQAVLFTIAPIIITGGIHLDGYCDTVDAFASNGDTNKKQSILKDPNIGAFSLIHTFVYLLVNVAAWYELDLKDIYIVVAVFVLSRALSGLSIFIFPCSPKSAMLKIFAINSHEYATLTATFLWIIAVFMFTVMINPIASIVAFFIAIVVLFRYGRLSLKHFDGINGDTAGYFLQNCELFALLSIILVQKVGVLWNLY